MNIYNPFSEAYLLYFSDIHLVSFYILLSYITLQDEDNGKTFFFFLPTKKKKSLKLIIKNCVALLKKGLETINNKWDVKHVKGIFYFYIYYHPFSRRF